MENGYRELWAVWAGTAYATLLRGGASIARAGVLVTGHGERRWAWAEHG